MKLSTATWVLCPRQGLMVSASGAFDKNFFLNLTTILFQEGDDVKYILNYQVWPHLNGSC
jgi:hypothetical protein